MKRRQFLGLAGATTAAMAAIGCSSQAELETEAAADSALPEISMEIATSWPPSLDTIFGGAQIFAERVSAMTGGKFNLTARAAGELVPGLEILQSVEQNSVSIGHTASYYYTGKSPATAFGTALPFGMTARQQNAWLYEGGGLQLMQDFYADKFGVIQFPAGNTGAQMGGWYNKEINTPADLEGLVMRIPGLGGEVMGMLGATVQVLPGGEIYQALQTGAIDATEWVGPYDDLTMGFHEVSKYYYYPGWWEPGPTLEIQFNLGEWDKLPEVYKEVVKTASVEANMSMLARYDAKNIDALATIRNESEVELRPFSSEVLQAAQEAAFSLYDQKSQDDSDFATIFKQWNAFREGLQEWHGFNEATYLNFIGGNA